MSWRNVVRPPLVLAVTLVAATSVLAATAGAAPALSRDYRMMGNLVDIKGGQVLRTYGTVPTFARETVDEQSTTVATFVQGAGFRTSGGEVSGPFTLSVLFRFDRVDAWARVWGYETGLTTYEDGGLYIQNGRLKWYVDGVVLKQSRTTVAADQWIQVVITRNASDRLKIYLDGIRQVTYLDSPTRFGPTGNDSFMWIFHDNTSGTGTGEESSGAVKRIRLWDGALSATRVASLDRLPPSSRMTLDRTSAARTSLLQVKGVNWAPSENVVLTLVDNAGNLFPLGTAATGTDGRFTQSVTVPQFAAVGTAKVKAVGQLSLDRRVRLLTIT